MILRGTVPSAVLGMDTGLTVITPGSYHLEQNINEQNQPYKAAYLLHGLYGNHTNWSDNTMLPVYANDYNMIFFMPEAARSYYTDMAYGLDYFTYIGKELPALCRRQFGISKKREDTLIIGGSMGGYGALKCGFTYPDVFGTVIALSSAGLFMKEDLERLRRAEQREQKQVCPDPGESEKMHRQIRDMKAVFGEMLECTPNNDLPFLIRQTQDQNCSHPDIYMICGTEDPYLEENRRFSALLEKTGRIHSSYTEMSGGHDWYFFNHALKKSLAVWEKDRKSKE